MHGERTFSYDSKKFFVPRLTWGKLFNFARFLAEQQLPLPALPGHSQICDRGNVSKKKFCALENSSEKNRKKLMKFKIIIHSSLLFIFSEFIHKFIHLDFKCVKKYLVKFFLLIRSR